MLAILCFSSINRTWDLVLYIVHTTAIWFFFSISTNRSLFWCFVYSKVLSWVLCAHCSNWIQKRNKNSDKQANRYREECLLLNNSNCERNSLIVGCICITVIRSRKPNEYKWIIIHQQQSIYHAQHFHFSPFLSLSLFLRNSYHDIFICWWIFHGCFLFNEKRHCFISAFDNSENHRCYRSRRWWEKHHDDFNLRWNCIHESDYYYCVRWQSTKSSWFCRLTTQTTYSIYFESVHTYKGCQVLDFFLKKWFPNFRNDFRILEMVSEVVKYWE